jgi:DNA invertase Pin-like site-specific DNA recombinase
MNDLPPDLQARRVVEDELAKLGSERNRIESEAGANIEAVVAAIPDAIEAGIPFDGIARLVGVSRQTLYRWQGGIARLRSGGT